MSLKKAAVAAVAATMIFTGSNAVAQESSANLDQQSTESSAGDQSSNGESSGSDSGSVADTYDNYEDTSANVGSTDVQKFYNENRDTIRPILIALAVLQGIALIAGPLRTIIYNVAGV